MKPTIGRFVRFVLPNGQVRPALIVNVKTDGHHDTPQLSLNIFVEDDDGFNRSPVMRSGVLEDPEAKTANTWHAPDLGAVVKELQEAAEAEEMREREIEAQVHADAKAEADAKAAEKTKNAPPKVG